MTDPRLLQRVERLLATKVKKDPSGCWLWQGAAQKEGYGTINVVLAGKRTSTTAHRLFYMALVGSVPAGETIHHKCHVRLCVNPEHLESISHRENMAEMFERRALEASRDHAEKFIEGQQDALTDAFRQDSYEETLP